MRFAYSVAFFALMLGAPLVFGQSGPLRIPTPDAIEKWNSTVTSAGQALKSNRLAEAVLLAEDAIAQARTFGPRDTHLARSQVLRAEIFLWEKKNDRAEALFHEAVTNFEAAVGPEDAEVVHPLSSLANFYYYVSPHYDRVAALFERILRIVEHAPAHDEREILMWSRNLGMLYAQMSQFERAEPLFKRAVALAEKIEPQWATHEYLASAQFYRAWRKFDPAEALARRALTAREAALKADPQNIDAKLDVAVALDELGAIALAAKKFDDAEIHCRRSLTLVESFMAVDQPDLRPRIAALADVYRMEGKAGAAAPLYARLLTLTEKNLGGESAELATVLANYADVLRGLHKADEAVALESRANEIRRHAAATL